MNYLFIHQSLPGQFPHLAKDLARDPKNTVYFLTRFGKEDLPGVRVVRYDLIEKHKKTHDHLQNLQNAVITGESVARALIKLEKESGFRPDLIYAHPGWGETLFVKEISPDVPLIHFAEFFYHTFGADSFATVDEVPEFDDRMRLKMKNAVNLMSLETCDLAVTPTEWQWRQQPARYREKISIIHDGIDTDAARPDSQAMLQLPDGTQLRFGDEVVTYVNRHLEPFRGMFIFAEAAAIVARHRPDCRFLIVGAETRKYYGPLPPKGQTYREMAIEKLGPARERCFFLGLLPYADLLRVLQISAAHVYLTRPFVLSWSMLDAMSAGCIVIGAASPPVAEVIRDEENGLLVDPYSSDELAERILEVLADRTRMKDIAKAARETIVKKYSLEVCLPAQKELIARAVANSQATKFGIPRIEQA